MAKKPPEHLLTEGDPPTLETDPLSEIIESIRNGELDKLEYLVKNQCQSSKSLRLFMIKERLLMKEVPRGWSPLVVAVENRRVDVLKYILKNFPVNIEQETISAGLPFDTDQKVTALRMAVGIRDNMECVKILVKKGADMNHVCSSPQATSPLAEALQSNQDAAIYLVRNAMTRGGSQLCSTQDCTHLLIQAVMDGNLRLTKLLVDKGANVNCTGPGGNTPLHFCTWNLKIARILVSAGAKNSLNDDGLSVVIKTASSSVLDCNSSLVDYLIKAFRCGPRELYDVYCIKVVMFSDYPSTKLAVPHLHRAVQIRSSHPDLFSDLPPADKIYNGLQEPATMDAFNTIARNKTSMFYLCCIYCERILGNNWLTMRTMRDCIRLSLDTGNYDKCTQFCHRYLDFGLNFSISECFRNVFRFIFEMLENGYTRYVPSIQPIFQYGLIAVEQEKEITHKNSLISSIVELVALWVKVADEYITDSSEQEREHTQIKKAIQELINTTGDSGATIIIDTLFKLYAVGTFISLHLGKVIRLVVQCGCSIQCRHPLSSVGNFPLHLAMELYLANQVPLDCVVTLLECGAHIDAVNFINETARSMYMSSLRWWQSQDNCMVSVIESFEAKPPTLQCLSARAISKYKIEYREYLPIKMAEFISWHSSDCATV